MKAKRSNRLVDMTRYLLDNPHTLIPLPFFVNRYESAKSSISEDLAILKTTFVERGIGEVKTIPGAAGGTIFAPAMNLENAQTFISDLKDQLNDDRRYLAGGFLYMADILNLPADLRNVGKLIATKYKDGNIDAVMTMATKGIPIAQSVSERLNVPFVVAQHNSKITDGSTISVNYVSASSSQIKRMVLSKRSLKPNSNVLIVDDYLKGGGTINGLTTLIREFNCNLKGIAVLAEQDDVHRNLSPQAYTSLLKVDMQNGKINVENGNYLSSIFHK